MIDHANHSRHAHVSWETDGSSFALQAHDTIELYTEVFNNYGPKIADERTSICSSSLQVRCRRPTADT